MYASLWMLFPGSSARYGCCGGSGAFTGRGVAGAPTYAGVPEGRGSSGMGIDRAVAVLSGTSASVAPRKPYAKTMRVWRIGLGMAVQRPTSGRVTDPADNPVGGRG
jgi:hypothetical protein